MDAPRTSIVRRLFASQITPVASAAVAASLAALIVLAMSTARDATAREASGAPGSGELQGPPAPASLSTLLGLPDGLAVVDEKGIGEAVRFAEVARFGEAVREQEIARFAEALAALPPPAAPAPAVEPSPPSPISAAPPAAEAPPPPAPPAPVVGAGLDSSPMDAYEQALFDATNARRAANGLSPLRPNGYLIGVARIRSQEMATHDYFSHTSPITGDNAFSLMDAYGISYGYAGENLAMNNYPNGECVGVADQALFDSPSHRENLLHPHYTDMGIGHAVTAEGMHYFTVIFTGPA